MDQVVFDYLNPKVPAGLRLVDAAGARHRHWTKGYGEIASPATFASRSCHGRLPDWRKLGAGTGIEAGTTRGFCLEWRGNELLGRNEAIGGHYGQPFVHACLPAGDAEGVASVSWNVMHHG